MLQTTFSFRTNSEGGDSSDRIISCHIISMSSSRISSCYDVMFSSFQRTHEQLITRACRDILSDDYEPDVEAVRTMTLRLFKFSARKPVFHEMLARTAVASCRYIYAKMTGKVASLIQLAVSR
eukprot:GHVU01126012.1.p2 GENE.GHVU01126012.1~~GHVU01126012.1.p2  ORF type:complete len:123 (-),score=4.52 GHVU01126012.1:377-745(-)